MYCSRYAVVHAVETLAVLFEALHHSDMFQTQRFIIACIALSLGVGVGFLISGSITTERVSQVDTPNIQVDRQTSVREFKNALALSYALERNALLADATPDMLVHTFPAIHPEDFDGVETVLGRYEFKDGQLTLTSADVVDGAADDITDAGIQTLRDNIYRRLKLDGTRDVVEIIQLLQSDLSVAEPSSAVAEEMSCTLDAKVCPDGTAVGRTGPNCEFAACPTTEPEVSPGVSTCSPESRVAEACIEIYAPVCATVSVQCVTTPCEPVEQTFSNSCFACQNELVSSYRQGECLTQ